MRKYLTDAEFNALVDPILRGASERVAKAAGAPAPGATAGTAGDRAAAIIEHEAGRLLAADPSLTPERAVVKAMERHPDVYEVLSLAESRQSFAASYPEQARTLGVGVAKAEARDPAGFASAWTDGAAPASGRASPKAALKAEIDGLVDALMYARHPVKITREEALAEILLDDPALARRWLAASDEPPAGLNP